MLKHLFQPLLDWYQHALESGGYWVVGLLMTMESSVLPLPSESIIPLAASWSNTGKIHIGLPGIVIAGAIGSWLGATLVYWLARLAGRPLLVRYVRFVLITPEKIHLLRKADARSIAAVSSTSSRCTFWPAGPVWCVTSCMPRIFLAYCSASSRVFATLTPPPLPRPPAWI